MAARLGLRLLMGCGRSSGATCAQHPDASPEGPFVPGCCDGFEFSLALLEWKMGKAGVEQARVAAPMVLAQCFHARNGENGSSCGVMPDIIALHLGELTLCTDDGDAEREPLEVRAVKEAARKFDFELLFCSTGHDRPKKYGSIVAVFRRRKTLVQVRSFAYRLMAEGKGGKRAMSLRFDVYAPPPVDRWRSITLLGANLEAKESRRMKQVATGFDSREQQLGQEKSPFVIKDQADEDDEFEANFPTPKSQSLSSLCQNWSTCSMVDEGAESSTWIIYGDLNFRLDWPALQRFMWEEADPVFRPSGERSEPSEPGSWSISDGEAAWLAARLAEDDPNSHSGRRLLLDFDCLTGSKAPRLPSAKFLQDEFFRPKPSKDTVCSYRGFYFPPLASADRVPLPTYKRKPSTIIEGRSSCQEALMDLFFSWEDRGVTQRQLRSEGGRWLLQMGWLDRCGWATAPGVDVKLIECSTADVVQLSDHAATFMRLRITINETC